MTEKDLTITLGVTIGFFAIIGILLLVAVFTFGKNKYCPECGTRYFNDAMYCTYDGTALKEIN